MILKKKKFRKIIEMDEKRLRKKVTLIMIDYEEGRLQPTPFGHAQLATPRANYFLLVDVLRKIAREFSKFDLRPEIGDGQAAVGAMTPHGKNRGKFFFQT
jgi:hypothetical protein